MIGTWRTKRACSMWPAAVVVGAVPGEDASQVPFAEDQDAVGDFGSGGQDESGRLELDGPRPLARAFTTWIRPSPFAASAAPPIPEIGDDEAAL